MTLKRIMTMTLAGACIITAFAGCGSTASSNADSTNSANSNNSTATTTANESKDTSAESVTSGGKTFTIGFDQDFPPYGYVGDDGEFTGFDLEMAAKLCERLGWTIKYQPINWDVKDVELNSGTIDCIWNGFTMNGREDDYTWSDAYMDNSQVFVVKADSGIKTHEDLAGKVVMAQTDSAAYNALVKDYADLVATFSNFMTTAQYNSAFMDLESGAIDAVAMDIGVAKYQIAGKEDKFTILEKTIVDEKYGIGFKKGNETLRDEVQTELKKMVSDGSFAEISKKWFEYDVCILEA